VAAKAALARLETLASVNDWESFSVTFFRDLVLTPPQELEALRATELWPPIVRDARASLGDIRAIIRYDFNADRFRDLRTPVLLQTGTESPPQLYVTDALAAVLPDVRVDELAGHAHEAMSTAPEMYAESVTGFCLFADLRVHIQRQEVLMTTHELAQLNIGTIKGRWIAGDG
jgi:hypothetical protein